LAPTSFCFDVTAPPPLPQGERGVKSREHETRTWRISMNPPFVNRPLSRREVLCHIGGGIGALGLSTVFADAGWLKTTPTTANNPLAPRAPHFTPRAKRLIFLFMNGGPSHVDTFDPKPALKQH